MRRAQFDSAMFLLRVVVGVIMVAHGWQKLSGAGLGGVGGMFDEMGVPLPEVAGPAVLLIELVGGILLLLGLGTRVVATVFGLAMLGALFIVHLPAGFYVADGGYEFVLLLAAASGALAITGPGTWAADALFARRRRASQVREPEREHAGAGVR